MATGETRQTSDPPYAATVYTAARGNVVFNAATCLWGMPLARPPGSRNPPNKDFGRADPRVQRVTRNLLDRIVASPGAGR